MGGTESLNRSNCSFTLLNSASNNEQIDLALQYKGEDENVDVDGVEEEMVDVDTI